MSAFDGVVDRTSALLGAAFDGFGGLGDFIGRPQEPMLQADPRSRFDFVGALSATRPYPALVHDAKTVAQAAPTAGSGMAFVNPVPTQYRNPYTGAPDRRLGATDDMVMAYEHAKSPRTSMGPDQMGGASMTPSHVGRATEMGAGINLNSASDRVRSNVSIIRQASAQTGVPESVIAAIMDTEKSSDPYATSSAGAMGWMQVMPFHFKPGENPYDPVTNITRGAEILAQNYMRYGTWEKAAAAYFGAIDANGNVTAAKDATGTSGGQYVGAFLRNLDNYQLGPTAQPTVGNVASMAAAILPQFGNSELSVEEAAAACGPIAATALATIYGDHIPLRKVVDAAATVGWSTVNGMGGPANEQRLLENLGIPTYLDQSRNWGAVANAAAQGHPVIISTGGGNVPVSAGHYFVALDYDADGSKSGKAGAYFVGNSGANALKQGATWMTQAEIESLTGSMNGAIYMR